MMEGWGEGGREGGREGRPTSDAASGFFKLAGEKVLLGKECINRERESRVSGGEGGREGGRKRDRVEWMGREGGRAVRKNRESEMGREGGREGGRTCTS